MPGQPVADQHRGQQLAVGLLPQHVVVAGVDEPFPSGRVVAAQQRVEFGQQPDAVELDRCRGVREIQVGPAVRTLLGRQPQPGQRGIHPGQAQPRPPGQVVPAGGSVGGDVVPQQRVDGRVGVGEHRGAVAEQRGRRPVARGTLTDPVATQRTPDQPAVSEREVAAGGPGEGRCRVRVVGGEPAHQVVGEFCRGAPVVEGEFLDAGPDLLQGAAGQPQGTGPQRPLAEPGGHLQQWMLLGDAGVHGAAQAAAADDRERFVGGGDRVPGDPGPARGQPDEHRARRLGLDRSDPAQQSEDVVRLALGGELTGHSAGGQFVPGQHSRSVCPTGAATPVLHCWHQRPKEHR